MQIIPVIDLKDGQVVHAVRGERAHYQPIHPHSKLTDSSQLSDVLAGFLKLHPFRQFYIADLNAISGNGGHEAMIIAAAKAHPHLEFWLDDGRQWPSLIPELNNIKPVIGTESQRQPPQASQTDFILSLDYKQTQAQGPAAWFTLSQFWPGTVIVMTLHRVGSHDGPDFDKLHALRQSHPAQHFVAAGGVRGYDDLLRLKTLGIQAALVATSLHTGSLSAEDLQNL